MARGGTETDSRRKGAEMLKEKQNKGNESKRDESPLALSPRYVLLGMTCSPRALDTRARTPGIYSPARARAFVRTLVSLGRVSFVRLDRLSPTRRANHREEREQMKNERETASPPSSSPAIDSKCHVSRASIRPSVRPFVRTHVRTHGTPRLLGLSPGRRVL